MPIRQNNTRTFHRILYAGELQTVTLLKRNDDQQEGTVASYKLFDCRRKPISKRGEPIQGGMTAYHETTWCIPRIELDRIGIAHLNALDRIVDKEGRYWQPEATTNIEVKLFQNHINLFCLRIDPPAALGSTVDKS